MKKVLLTGANGQLGSYIQKLCSEYQGIELIALTRNELNLAQSESIRKVILHYKPDVVINAAAYTAVDKAELERELAMRVNGLSVGELAKTCEELGSSLIQISTDYVFNGEKGEPYLTDDQTDPVNFYGESKLMGEQLATSHCSKAVVVRTSWVHSEIGSNFETTMRRLFREREELNIIDDQVGRPTHARDLARHCLELAKLPAQSSRVTHFAGQEIMTWFGLAKKLFKTEENPVTLVINPIESSQYPTPAKRPRYSVLDLSL